MTVIDFMKKYAKFHSDMTYDLTRKGFFLDKCLDTTTGIYFIIRKDTKDITSVR